MLFRLSNGLLAMGSFQDKGKDKKKNFTCLQAGTQAFFHLGFKKKLLKHLISHGNPLMLILRGPQEAKDNQIYFTVPILTKSFLCSLPSCEALRRILL